MATALSLGTCRKDRRLQIQIGTGLGLTLGVGPASRGRGLEARAHQAVSWRVRQPGRQWGGRRRKRRERLASSGV